MPTVYLPLASAEAYGAVGEMMVFQGQTCRAYVVPYDPRTNAQLNVRELFYDVTKMQTFCGAWVKSAWKITFGSRWYTSLYKRVTENGAARYNAAATVWDGFTTEQKEAWNLAAPFKVTYNPPGEVFYAVMVVMSDWMTELGAPGYEFPGIDADNAAGIGEWAVWTLEDVLTSGSYEDSNALLTYAGSWSLISDASASGGAYRQSAATGTPSVSFYFHGTQLSLAFEKNTGRGAALVETFGMADQTINQNDSVQIWQVEWVSVGLPKGLHYVTITRTGTGAINLDAIGISSKVIKTPAQQGVIDYFVIPGASVYRTAVQDVLTSWTLIEWQAFLWDTQGMFSANVEPGRLTCKVPGFYSVRALVKISAYVSNTINYELRLNGIRIADDLYVTPTSGGVQTAIMQCARNIELIEGNYLELWMKRSSAGAPVSLVIDLPVYPIAEVQMLMRTSLQVETVNVTEQVGSTIHGEMQQLDDDDHTQYLTTTRGNALYSLLAHLHGSNYSALSHLHDANYSPIAQGQSVLSAGYNITAVVAAYVDVGLSVTLPDAGTYEIWADVRSEMRGTVGTFWWVGVKLYNSTDAANVANSERIVVFTGTTGLYIQNTAPIRLHVTVAASKVIKLYAKRDAVGAGATFSVSYISSDAEGRSVLGYKKLSA